MKNVKTLCSISSLESNEAMYGTATNAQLWCLVEYRGNFSGKAFNDSKIPQSVKKHLNKELKKISGSRIQLIKKHKNEDEELRLFLAESDERNPKLHEIRFNNYEDLLDLDFKKILKSGKNLSEEKVYIICTNGEYDTCCGKIGMPVYLDVAKGHYGPRTWEANHIGGHRFAATFVCLPEGIVYGRAQNGKEAERLIKCHEQGEVDIAYLRGRSCYKSDVQAAEYYIRRENGIKAIGDLQLKSSKSKHDHTAVRFISKDTEKSYKIKIAQEKKAVSIIKSCGDGMSSIPQFTLLDYKKK